MCLTKWSELSDGPGELKCIRQAIIIGLTMDSNESCSVWSLKRLIEALLKCKDSTTLSPFNFKRNKHANDWFRVLIRIHHASPGCHLIVTIQTIPAWEANFYCGGRNLKSRPRILYALWLPTASCLLPGDTRLHQTGETNRISSKQRVGPPAVCWSASPAAAAAAAAWDGMCVCWMGICVKWKVMNGNWRSLVFPDSNNVGFHL